MLQIIEQIDGVFDVKIYKLITDIETGGQNISMQVFFQDKKALDAFKSNNEPKMYELADERFSGKYVYFHSLLEEI